MKETKKTYLIKQTVVEHYVYDPEEIKAQFAAGLEQWEGTFEQFVLHMFEETHGSAFGDRIFYDDANPSVNIELIQEWSDD